jgi:hypothetical protein
LERDAEANGVVDKAKYIVLTDNLRSDEALQLIGG